MRLLSVDVNNFGSLLETSLELEPATVIVGPNDSGKSTLMRAIRSLFTDKDADGRPFDYWSVKSTPLVAVDYLEDSRVLGAFGDLSEQELDVWGDLTREGVLRAGTYFRWQDRDGPLPGVRCVVLAPEHADELLSPSVESVESFASWVRRHEEELPPGKVLPRDPVRFLDGYVWIPWLYTGLFGRKALEDDGWNSSVLSKNRVGQSASVLERLWGASPFMSNDNLIHFTGPEQGVPSVVEIVRPIVRRLLARGVETGTSPAGDDAPALSAIDAAIGKIHDASDGVTDIMDARYAIALERFTGHTGGARFTLREELDADQVLDQIVSELSLVLTHTRPGDPEGWDSYSVQSLGAGAQRAAALAALELHTDPDLWSPGDWLVLLIEEPEVGLYPGAQKRLAAALRELPKFGVQVVTVTHSPALVDSVPRNAIRVAETGVVIHDPDGDEPIPLNANGIRAVPDLKPAADVLGCSPSDILLSERIVLVEGASRMQQS